MRVDLMTLLVVALRVILADVGLRDGNQALKQPMNRGKKQVYFDWLKKLGIRAVELGFPAADPEDAKIVAELAAQAVPGMTVGALAMATESHIRIAGEALATAPAGVTKRIHTFISTWPHAMQHSLGKSPEAVREMAIESVRLARSLVGPTNDVQFSPEHFGDCWDNLNWVIEVLRDVVAACANVINLPNTVERSMPWRFVEMVRRVDEALDDDLIISIHNHNDLGMATATSLMATAVNPNRRWQIECTLNGTGERAGNTSLQEVAIALMLHGVQTGINFERIYEASLAVADLLDMPISPKAPHIGREVTVQRSGIHQKGAGVTQERNVDPAYLAYRPERIGRPPQDFEFTPQSGYFGVMQVVLSTGETISETEARVLQPALKATANQHPKLTAEEIVAVLYAYRELTEKKTVEAADIEALAKDVISRMRGSQYWRLVRAYFNSSSSGKASCQLRLTHNSTQFEDVALGDGPVNAAVNALSRITGLEIRVSNYQAAGVTAGSDAQGEVTLNVQINGGVFAGEGLDTDLNVAAVRAVINGINKALEANHLDESAPAASVGT